MGVIRWQPPPFPLATRHRSTREQLTSRWQEAAEELASRPGEWGVLLEGSNAQCSALVQYVKHGKDPFGPPGAYEACSRALSKRETATYARYVGGAA